MRQPGRLPAAVRRARSPDPDARRVPGPLREQQLRLPGRRELVLAAWSPVGIPDAGLPVQAPLRARPRQQERQETVRAAWSPAGNLDAGLPVRGPRRERPRLPVRRGGRAVGSVRAHWEGSAPPPVLGPAACRAAAEHSAEQPAEPVGAAVRRRPAALVEPAVQQPQAESAERGGLPRPAEFVEPAVQRPQAGSAEWEEPPRPEECAERAVPPQPAACAEPGESLRPAVCAGRAVPLLPEDAAGAAPRSARPAGPAGRARPGPDVGPAGGAARSADRPPGPSAIRHPRQPRGGRRKTSR